MSIKVGDTVRVTKMSPYMTIPIGTVGVVVVSEYGLHDVQFDEVYGEWNGTWAFRNSEIEEVI